MLALLSDWTRLCGVVMPPRGLLGGSLGLLQSLAETLNGGMLPAAVHREGKTARAR